MPLTPVSLWGKLRHGGNPARTEINDVNKKFDSKWKAYFAQKAPSLQRKARSFGFNPGQKGFLCVLASRLCVRDAISFSLSVLDLPMREKVYNIQRRIMEPVNPVREHIHRWQDPLEIHRQQVTNYNRHECR